jgi:DNA-binding response OmpR family regulator
MRILIAEDEPVSRELLKRIISARTRYEVVAVDNGKDALDQALSDEPFDVLLLDWMMPERSGPEVCRRVRAAALEVEPYISLVTAKNMRQEMLEGLSAGADDFIPKPIAPDLLLARLEVAKRRPKSRGQGSTVVHDALLAARAQGDGELVVKDGERAARVFFHAGQVAWAHLSDDSTALLDLISAETALTPDDAREVLAECRRSGSRLTDTLVAFGLVDRATLRVSLLNWTKRQLDKVSGFAQPQALFLPKKRRYAEDLLFELEELIDVELPTRGSLRPEASERGSGSGSWADSFTQPEPSGATHGLEALLERCAAGDGVLGAALLDRSSGVCLAHRGTLLNPDIAWAHIHAFNVICREESLEDSVVVTGTHYHLVRLLEPGGALFVYVLVRGKDVLLAMARVALQRAVEERALLIAEAAATSKSS